MLHRNGKIYHSFVGEAACGRWSIRQNRAHIFIGFCDYIAMKKILNYEGEAHMICCWAQKNLDYHYSIIHRCARMMRYVDAISRRFSPSIESHIRAVSLLVV